MNCIYILSQFLKNHKLSINLDGKIFKMLSQIEYKLCLLRLISLVIIGFLAHIIRKIPYHPITIMGNTIYSRVAAYCLSQHNISYILCKGTNQIPYYQTSRGDEIAFEGPNPNYFSQDMIIPLISYSSEELNKIEKHTNLKNLHHIQTQILSKFATQNNVHLLNLNHITQNNTSYQNPVIDIKHFCGNLYYVMTNNDIWITHLIISDVVSSLQTGEIITGFDGYIKNKSQNTYAIEKFSDHCLIRHPQYKMTLHHKDMYKVEADLSISHLDDKNDNCIIYCLKNPRPWYNHGINILHPFHLPF